MTVAVTVVSDAELERARIEVTEFIDDLLAEYVAKTVDVNTPPLWDFAPVFPPVYYPKAKKILIPLWVPLMWARDRAKAKPALRWAIGHEFYHYVQEVRAEHGGIRGIQILSFPRIAEYAAMRQAVRLSGVTNTHGMALWRELMRGLAY